jgi:hypothetical protein
MRSTSGLLVLMCALCCGLHSSAQQKLTSAEANVEIPRNGDCFSMVIRGSTDNAVIPLTL